MLTDVAISAPFGPFGEDISGTVYIYAGAGPNSIINPTPIQVRPIMSLVYSIILTLSYVIVL